jgi:hypothetical protein
VMDGSAQRMPMTRMSRSFRSEISLSILGLVKVSPETSTTTGFPAKNPGDRESHVSTSAIHRPIGVSGFRTKARNERLWKCNDREGWDAVAMAVPAGSSRSFSWEVIRNLAFLCSLGLCRFALLD